LVLPLAGYRCRLGADAEADSRGISAGSSVSAGRRMALQRRKWQAKSVAEAKK
jgi:hypothetical protein